jgi:hypothetical protein
MIWAEVTLKKIFTKLYFPKNKSIAFDFLAYFLRQCGSAWLERGEPLVSGCVTLELSGALTSHGQGTKGIIWIDPLPTWWGFAHSVCSTRERLTPCVSGLRLAECHH